MVNYWKWLFSRCKWQGGINLECQLWLQQMKAVDPEINCLVFPYLKRIEHLEKIHPVD